MVKAGTLQLARISVRGVVQGVGFRPFVYQLASKYNLTGWVCSTSEDVKIEVEGNRESLDRFLLELQNNAPPLASIEGISHTYHGVAGYNNCGPRFTIIMDIPYDCPQTTVRTFQMCPQCQAEYDNPLDRRFHAQPDACPNCGPVLQLTDTQGNWVAGHDAIATASQLLREGKIVAIKGLGGFLLACDATNDAAVRLLRHWKHRPFKPLAIMVSNLDEAKNCCEISEKEEELLTSPQSPIVLMQWKSEFAVSSTVAPNLKYLGVMLPYTPLHHLLLDAIELPLVMTSGSSKRRCISKSATLKNGYPSA